jgi:Acetoacetate decarboxylase (ADC)
MISLVEPTATISDVKRRPAPWNLHGRGYILLFQFPKGFVAEMGRIPAFLSGSFAGGLGAVMIVDYAASNVGPYGELLFIPGKFHLRGKKLDCITKIYVSTKASVVNGWENWAIPKEQADFSFVALEDKGEEKVIITKGGKPVLDITLRHGGMSFPMHTRLLPFPLVQEKDGRLYYTSFTGKGTAQFAHIENMRVNPELFPDVGPFRPLVCMRVDHFALTFPPSQVTVM